MQPGAEADDVAHVLASLLQQFTEDRATNIGFPGATDFDYSDLAPFLNVLLNNVGDPYVDGVGANHTKAMELEVVDFLANMFALPANDRWGYVTTGGTEANLFALYLARQVHPDAMVYFSAAAHDSVPKAADLLRMPRMTVRVDDTGEMDYEDLHAVVGQHRDRPAVVVATIGTTMTEAVDDAWRIQDVMRSLAVGARFIHADAALAGIPFALDVDERPGVERSLAATDSICISGHKFVGSPVPCAVLLTRDSLRHRVSRPGSYTGAPDSTITGSRSGLAPLFLWYRLHQIGWTEGLRKRVAACRELAEYAHRRLTEIGWEAWRVRDAFTVVIRTPPAEVLARWTLASRDGWSHVICMPGVDRDHIDGFVEALQASQPPSPTQLKPVPRRDRGAHLVRPAPRGAAVNG